MSAIILAALAPGCAVDPDRSLSIAAAADLRYALEDVARAFRAQNSGLAVKITYGSSGAHYSQIQNRAPFDLFLSADAEYPRRLAGAGLVVPGSVFVYAVGRIALWTRADSPVDVARLGMRSLMDPMVKHVAIANPAHAPYGRAAEAAMRSAGVYNSVTGKLVLGENISQTLEYVQSGAADVGIVALSLALAPPVRAQGRYWEPPPNTYPPIEQAGAILAHAQHLKAAAAFREFLLSEGGRAVLRQYGFSLPEK